jgi:hypothetical protein
LLEQLLWQEFEPLLAWAVAVIARAAPTASSVHAAIF